MSTVAEIAKLRSRIARNAARLDSRAKRCGEPRASASGRDRAPAKLGHRRAVGRTSAATITGRPFGKRSAHPDRGACPVVLDQAGHAQPATERCDPSSSMASTSSPAARLALAQAARRWPPLRAAAARAGPNGRAGVAALPPRRCRRGSCAGRDGPRSRAPASRARLRRGPRPGGARVRGQCPARRPRET